jgi:hypothetical protein
LSKRLKIKAATIGNWEKAALSKTILKNAFKSVIDAEKNRIAGVDFIQFGKKRYSKSSDKDIADLLGISQPSLGNWRKNGLTISSLYQVLEKAKHAHTKKIVTPIIEFYPIKQAESRQGSSYEILPRDQLVAKALREELEQNNGIYIYHDSRGSAVYVGKAKEQMLWKEMNLAYNRKRGDSQSIRKVAHLSINRFVPEDERRRQITPHKVLLHHIAVYFSAYRVDKVFIDSLEAAIIRMFPNDLLNKRIERFRIKK